MLPMLAQRELITCKTSASRNINKSMGEPRLVPPAKTRKQMGEEESDHRWEDAIDVDDSDLLPLLRPLLPPVSTAASVVAASPNLGYQTLDRPLSLRPCSQISRPSQTLAPNPVPSPSLRPPIPTSRFQSQPVLPEEGDEPSLRTAAASVPRRIPGPAGAVQAAMQRRSAVVLAAHQDGSSLQEPQWDDQALGIGLDDGDFKLNPWLCAMEFLGADFDWVPSISSIKTRTAERVPQVVGLVKSCSSNGLGDLFLTLKDPSGSIGASVHRGVLSERNLGGVISVGCVLILKQVVAFCPSRSVCYLNVTQSNVVKLISKDCGPPGIQALHSVAALCGHYGKRMEAGLGTNRKELSLWDKTEGCAAQETRGRPEGCAVVEPRERSETCAILEHRKHETIINMAERTCERFVETEPHLEAAEPSGRHKLSIDQEAARNFECHWRMDERDAGPAGSFSHVSTGARSSARRMSSASYLQREDLEFERGGLAEPSGMHGPTAYEEPRTSNHSRSMLPITNASSFLSANIAKGSRTVVPPKADHGSEEAEKQISKVSVAQWTDEQLLELFSDYQDEIDIF